MRKLTLSVVLTLVSAFAVLAQTDSQTMYIGEVQLRLGMPEDAAMKLLTVKYIVTANGPGLFMVKQYDSAKKIYNFLGSITINNGQVTYLVREMDTSAWPNDEGYAVGRAIYDALGSSITRTDSDGAKRTNARIVISNQDVAAPTPGTIRTIHIYINERNIAVTIWDGTNGRSVGASVAISIKPWP